MCISLFRTAWQDTCFGVTLAEYLVSRCTGGNCFPRTFDSAQYPTNLDFTGRELYDTTTGQFAPKAYGSETAALAPAPALSPLLNWLWGEALKEWM